MGWKKKVKKSVKTFEKRIKEHENKVEKYKKEGGKNQELIDYWEEEIERFKKFKEEEGEKL